MKTVFTDEKDERFLKLVEELDLVIISALEMN